MKQQIVTKSVKYLFTNDEKMEFAIQMDSESPSSKKRSDAIARASKRALEWIANQLGRDAAEGFKASFHEITRTNLELVEGGAK